MLHLFFKCEFVAKIWEKMKLWLDFEVEWEDSVIENFLKFANLVSARNKKLWVTIDMEFCGKSRKAVTE